MDGFCIGGVRVKEQILSVGIDIGTSTTQLVFSKLYIENRASVASIPRINIVGKEIIYKSDIYFTPLISNTEIDADSIKKIIENEYAKAGIDYKKVRTGAVIITGETARKENASQIVYSLSDLAGDFVVATAGPVLESIIAGKGTGAEQLSKDNLKTVANLDIGGGTTNIAVFKDGNLIDTTCLNIGGRLIKFQEKTNRIIYISEKIKYLLEKGAIRLKEGMLADAGELDKLMKKATSILDEVLGFKPVSPVLEKMLVGNDLKRNYKIDYVTFSGGVADYIYNNNNDDVFKFNDIGPLLGMSIKKFSVISKDKIKKGKETIRATVVGAGIHTTELSGSTITYSPGVLPLRNIPILKLFDNDQEENYEMLDKVIEQKISWYLLENEVQQLAISFKGMKNPSFKMVQFIAKKIIKGMQKLIVNDKIIIVVIENDFAKVLGQTISRLLNAKHKVICIDSVKLNNEDYIDIGKPVADGRVVPIIIKTLVFNS
jgi:ethanolamine utilization protein EutA